MALASLGARHRWSWFLRDVPVPVAAARRNRVAALAGPDPRLVGAVASVVLHVVAGLSLTPLSPLKTAPAEPLRVSFVSERKVEPARPIPAAPAKVEAAPVSAMPLRAVPVPAEPGVPAAQPAAMAVPVEGSPSMAGPTAPVAVPAPAATAAPRAPARPAPAAAIVPPVFDAAYLRNPAPAYPLMSRKRGEHGRVLLRVRVNPEGSAEEVLVRDSSGFARLDEAAAAAVRAWRFVPAREGDRTVAAWVLVPIEFSMEN